MKRSTDVKLLTELLRVHLILIYIDWFYGLGWFFFEFSFEIEVLEELWSLLVTTGVKNVEFAAVSIIFCWSSKDFWKLRLIFPASWLLKIAGGSPLTALQAHFTAKSS